jgi:hypothetical protein
LDPELPPGNGIATRDYSVVAERRAWLGYGSHDAGHAFPDDARLGRLEGTRDMLLLHDVQGIAASSSRSLAVILKVTAEALAGAGRGRIRALEVRVRVVRRSGQRGRESGRYGCGRAGAIEEAARYGGRGLVVIVVVVVRGGGGDTASG